MAETDWVYLDKDPYAMPGDSNTDLVYYIDPQDGEGPFCYWALEPLRNWLIGFLRIIQT